MGDAAVGGRHVIPTEEQLVFSTRHHRKPRALGCYGECMFFNSYPPKKMAPFSCVVLGNSSGGHRRRLRWKCHDRFQELYYVFFLAAGLVCGATEKTG